jgi:S-adenosyl-L-methionine hydrolase (adenosine-forming)
MAARKSGLSIVTLTTDFGTTDHFAGTMKGVILGIAPRVSIVDITHEVTPFEVAEGAFTIGEAYRWFPKGTVHVVVVDPGVGTERHPVLVEAAGQYFIGPDNGVFTIIYESESHRVRAIANEAYFLPDVSRTFHGRDIFAPCAAHLAAGVLPSRFGKRIEGYVQLGLMKPRQMARRVWAGVVLKVDRFGNLITNLNVDTLPDIRTRPFELSVGLRQIAGLAATFGECAPGEIANVIGSSGYLEVAVNQGSAAKTLGCGAGAPVEITFF